MTTSKQQVLAILAERNVELPDDRVTVEKIRRRGTHFDVVENEYLSFRLERHPTMYLSDSLPGHHRSPSRFHVRTEYQLSLDTVTWSIEELESTFDFDPHLVIQAELDGRRCLSVSKVGEWTTPIRSRIVTTVPVLAVGRMDSNTAMSIFSTIQLNFSPTGVGERQLPPGADR